jgi:hypothetical protein
MSETPKTHEEVAWELIRSENERLRAEVARLTQENEHLLARLVTHPYKTYAVILGEEYDTLVMRVKQAEAALAAMTAERDLAVAHDRQPYPTAHAYEQVCKTLTARTAERNAAAERLAQIEALRENLSSQYANPSGFEAAFRQLLALLDALPGGTDNG